MSGHGFSRAVQSLIPCLPERLRRSVSRPRRSRRIPRIYLYHAASGSSLEVASTTCRDHLSRSSQKPRRQHSRLGVPMRSRCKLLGQLGLRLLLSCMPRIFAYTLRSELQRDFGNQSSPLHCALISHVKQTQLTSLSTSVTHSRAIIPMAELSKIPWLTLWAGLQQL